MHNLLSAFFSIPRNEGSENADSIAFKQYEEKTFCIALADGVGKSIHGPDASRIATNIATSEALTKSIPAIFDEARSALISGASKTPGAVWSTTLTVCKVSNYRAVVGHVGDARLYHLRGEGIVTRTRDQTELQALLDEGVISKERAKKYPRKNVLLSALSSESNYNLQVTEFEVTVGDRLLIVSDGVYKQILRREIAELSAKAPLVDVFINSLCSLLKERGIVDDSTALCIELD
ncbi:serine/threonine-protein phosphatase [Curvibacter sp. CHRR-16]|uniref:PP2C family protein-serine/threonine phosphatase n=1 Tax=Curvibacter sp. CHRR-16 TaxID=2835872 RepID=UPI001BDAA2EB|nr:PP2C family serine/threonine-protein phosphatase [Curvibacter sp. CHRR-16]MBT0570956.1 serine/threonine-protein phosphatase [Curvibacter sp. CHRR-16]